MTRLCDSFDGFLVDLDGVVHVGWKPVPGAVRTLTGLAAAGKGIVFLTNEPRFSREQIALRLRSFGLAVTVEQVVTAGWVGAVRVARGGGTVYVLGSAQLRDEVTAAGAPVLSEQDAGAAAKVLVSGHDDVDYRQLRAACRAGSNGAELYATSRDPTFPMPDGPWPATGAILAAVETAVGRRAVSVGKPEPHIFRMARARLGPGRIAVVGDRVDTDITGGRRAGLATILVRGEEPGEGSPAADHELADLTGLLGGE